LSSAASSIHTCTFEGSLLTIGDDVIFDEFSAERLSFSAGFETVGFFSTEKSRALSCSTATVAAAAATADRPAPLLLLRSLACDFCFLLFCCQSEYCNSDTTKKVNKNFEIQIISLALQ
jgi:hypothetical protein